MMIVAAQTFRVWCNPCYFSSIRMKSRRVVYHSDDDIPHRNLAFEEWIYDNVDLNNSSCLFLWRSRPSIVIGRHQNPWLECNLKHLRNNNIFLARRQTGGGTVFHDYGNLNVSFFTSRSSYNRKENLQFLVDSLQHKYKLTTLSINERDDIMLDDKYKVSGSAAKLGRCNAYHHCTILMDSNLDLMSLALQSSLPNLKTRATFSVRSQTKNLSHYAQEIAYKDLRDVLAQSYLEHGREFEEKHLVQVDPSDNVLFPGISATINRLNSWDWIYAKSPKFVVNVPNVGELTIVGGVISDIAHSEEKFPVSIALKMFRQQLIGLRFTRKELLDFKANITEKVFLEKDRDLYFALQDIINNM